MEGEVRPSANGYFCDRLKFEYKAAMISNICNVAGVPDMRNKLMPESKSVTYDIYFDVNKGVVKPE